LRLLCDTVLSYIEASSTALIHSESFAQLYPVWGCSGQDSIRHELVVSLTINELEPKDPVWLTVALWLEYRLPIMTH